MEEVEHWRPSEWESPRIIRKGCRTLSLRVCREPYCWTIFEPIQKNNRDYCNDHRYEHRLASKQKYNATHRKRINNWQRGYREAARKRRSNGKEANLSRLSETVAA